MGSPPYKTKSLNRDRISNKHLFVILHNDEGSRYFASKNIGFLFFGRTLYWFSFKMCVTQKDVWFFIAQLGTIMTWYVCYICMLSFIFFKSQKVAHWACPLQKLSPLLKIIVLLVHWFSLQFMMSIKICIFVDFWNDV